MSIDIVKDAIQNRLRDHPGIIFRSKKLQLVNRVDWREHELPTDFIENPVLAADITIDENNQLKYNGTVEIRVGVRTSQGSDGDTLKLCELVRANLTKIYPVDKLKGVKTFIPTYIEELDVKGPFYRACIYFEWASN